MKNRIVSSYKIEKDNDFIATLKLVTTNLDGNASFPNPPEALANIKKKLPDFEAAVVNAKGRDPLKVSLKNDLRAILEAELKKLADFVTQVSNGDRSLLLSSGFALRSARTEAGLGSISNLQVVIDRPSEATTRIKRVNGARSYVHQYTAEPLTSGSIWTSKTLTDTSYTFTGLESAVKYLFQVIAIGFKGQEAYSPMVKKVIQ